MSSGGLGPTALTVKAGGDSILLERKNKSFAQSREPRSAFTTRKNEEEFPHKCAAVKSEDDESGAVGSTQLWQSVS